jgi:16S rRNA (cytosine967-C5)-methyltransferase
MTTPPAHTPNGRPPDARAPDARGAALGVLRAVLERGRPLDDVLATSAALVRLAPRDRAFARRLVATTLRRLGQIDQLLDRCLDRPLKPQLAAQRNLLRLGAVQLAFLDTPPHAAVSTALALARRAPLAGYKGLINAVLRRLAREAATLRAEQDAARLNTPDWLWDSWCAAYGEATARRIATAHLADPPFDLTLRDPGAAADWAARLDADILPGGTLRLPAAPRDVTALAGYAEGAWWVQDAAAALPARLLGDVAGRRVIDLCAAPGGKTAQLAAAGAQVTAVEISPARRARIVENLDRLKLSAETVTADAADWRPAAPADAVLLDAPCSATGTIRRHPDIAWLKQPGDVAALAALQARLLEAALEMVAPGGLLVYATCSLQPEEGSQRIAALLAARDDLVRGPIAAAELGADRDDLAALITPEGDLRSLPCHFAERGGLDGFYACRLRRR